MNVCTYFLLLKRVTKQLFNPEQMRELVLQLKQDYDYAVIDCPAGIEQGYKNAVAGADKALVVTTPEVSAVRDADRIIDYWSKRISSLQNWLLTESVVI